jgi:hypothetical protein
MLKLSVAMSNGYVSITVVTVVLVATGIADVSFYPSLLASWAADIEAAHHYYDAWPL